MSIFSKVATAIQSLFGSAAKDAADKPKIIQRERVFTAETLAQTFVLGHAKNPAATFEEMAQTAAECGAPVSPQAIDKRFNPETEAFLKDLFTKAVAQTVEADKTRATILERFPSVIVIDSSTISLPEELKDQWAGCGGRGEGGNAAMKCQVEFNLRNGGVSHIEIEPGKSPDSASARQNASPGEGSLRISDLGYFDTTVFAQIEAKNEYFLSRLNFGTKVAWEEKGEAMDAQLWLNRQPSGMVDCTVWLGAAQRLKCRLIAFRVPSDVAAQRRRKLREKIMDERGCEPSQARLAWCDWVIMVTNVPEDKMTAKEALVLYRARWQIELLFKRWKSHDLVAVLTGSTVVRKMVRVWSRLLAALLVHWLLLSSVWGDPTKSLDKAAKRLRGFISCLIGVLGDGEKLVALLGEIATSFAKTCKRTKRKRKPGTFEMLNDVDLLEFELS